MQDTDINALLGHATIDTDRLTVGRHGTWSITYTAGQTPIEPGGDIHIRPYGNPLVRPPGQTVLPGEDNYVTVEAPAHVGVEIECTEWLFTTVTIREGTLSAGDQVRVTFGDTTGGSAGFKIKTIAHDMPFRVSVRPAQDDEPRPLPERPQLRLVPDEIVAFRLRAPSVVDGESEIDLVLRAVDQYGNTAAACDDEFCIDPVEGLDVPPAASLDAPNGAFTRTTCRRAGVTPLKRVRLAARNRAGEIVARSNPVELNAGAGEDRVFWGDIHCHSDLEQGLRSPEFVYEYARDQERLDFLCHVEHNLGVPTRWTGKRYKTWRGGVPDVPAYNEDAWEYRKGLVRKYHEPGRFATLLGLEWATNLYGHMNVYYPDLDGPLLYPHSMWDSDETPARVFEALRGQDAIIIPHHPSAPVGTGNPPHYWATSGFDWNYYDRDMMRLVEIYSKWGNSEHFGCRRPLLNQQVEGCVQTALARGYRLGFVGSSDTHSSRPGSDLYGDHTYSQSGLTAVFAPSLDRRAIYDALKARRCYATTGQRILLRFWLNDHFMGEDVELDSSDEWKDIFVDVATDSEIETVEVLKNGRPFYRYNGHLTPDLGWWRDNGWETAVRVLDKEPTVGTDYYYVRVVQRDGGMAWSSPIWVTSGPNVSQFR